MKKCIMAILFILALSSVAFASPLTDYSKGKAALDINYRVSPDYDVDGSAGDHSLKDIEQFGIHTSNDGDSNVEWGFTYGIGNNWALQYRQATPKGNLNINLSEPPMGVADLKMVRDENNNVPIASIETKTRVEEYNVMYKIDKNFSAFTGIVRANPSFKYNDNDFDVTLRGHDKNIWQFGVVATKPLNNDFTTYGIASLGSDYRNWEVGLGYKMTKELEFNVNYRDMKVEDMKLGSVFGTDVNTDTRVKGWGFGVTYNF